MELKFLFTGVNVGGKVETAVGLLPGAKKSQSKFSGYYPADLPVSIAAIQIQTGKVLKNRKRISAMDVDVRQYWSQCPSCVDPEQQLVKMSTGSIVSAYLILMSRNRNADKRCNDDWFPAHVVSYRKVRVLNRSMPQGIKIQGAFREPPFVF